MRYIKVTRDRVYLYIPYVKGDPSESRNLKQLIPSASWAKEAKRYSFALSKENLQKLRHLYGADIKVEAGQEFIEELKKRTTDFKTDAALASTIKAGAHPVDFSHAKIPPYEHQKVGTAMVQYLPNTALLCSCGTGKSFMVSVAIENLLRDKQLTKGKVLIVAPLNVVFSTWLVDGPKFTHLKFASLWLPSETKIEYGTIPTIYEDYGNKPTGYKKIVRKEFTVQVNSKNEIYDPNRHTNAVSFNVKKAFRYSCAVMEDGEEIRFGKATLHTFRRVNVKLDKMRDILKTNADVFLINHEGIHLYEDILSEHRFEMIAVDESSKIKSRTSKETQALFRLAETTKRRVIMSGTPAPNGPEDLWSQFYFLDRGLTLQPHYTDFLSTHFKQFKFGLVRNPERADYGKFHHIEWNPTATTTKEIHDLIAPFVYRVKLRDCVDLPPLTRVIKKIALSSDQSSTYEELDETLRAEIPNTTDVVEVNNALTKILRLREITGGFTTAGEISDEKQIKEFKLNPKLEVMDEILEEIGDERLIIFAQRTWEINTLKKHFGDKAAIISGAEPNQEIRNQTFKNFEAGKVQILICQPQSTAHGLNLQYCHYIAFYSVDHNYDIMQQAVGRIERIGQKEKMVVFYLLAINTIDELIYESLQHKENVQQQLIDNTLLKLWRNQK